MGGIIHLWIHMGGAATPLRESIWAGGHRGQMGFAQSVTTVRDTAQGKLFLGPVLQAGVVCNVWLLKKRS